MIYCRCQRPYHVERTRSRQLPEVKLRRAPLVLGWVTAWEYGVLLAYTYFNLENAHLHFKKSMLKTYALHKIVVWVACLAQW